MNWYKKTKRTVLSDSLNPFSPIYEDFNPEAFVSSEIMLGHFRKEGIDNIPPLYRAPQNKTSLDWALRYFQEEMKGKRSPYSTNTPTGTYNQNKTDVIDTDRIDRIAHDISIIADQALEYLYERIQNENLDKKAIKSAKRLMIGMEACMSNALTTLYKIVLYPNEVQESDSDQLDIFRIKTDEGKFNTTPSGSSYSGNIFRSLGLNNVSSKIDWSKLVSAPVVAESIKNTEKSIGEQLWGDGVVSSSYADLQSFFNINDNGFRQLLSEMATSFDPEAIAAFISTTKLLPKLAIEGNETSLNNRGHVNTLPNYNYMRGEMGIPPVKVRQQIDSTLQRPDLGPKRKPRK